MLLPLDQALEITDSNKKSGYYNFNCKVIQTTDISKKSGYYNFNCKVIQITDINKKSGYYNFNILENNQYINKLTGLMKYYLII